MGCFFTGLVCFVVGVHVGAILMSLLVISKEDSKRERMCHEKEKRKDE